MLDILQEIEKDARERHIPVILGDSLEELVALVENLKPKRILEIGTAIGYSGSIMLLHSPSECVLDTVELMPERYEEAQGNFARFGLTERVNGYLGDAMELIPKMIEGNTYDLVFIDGPKSKYGQYMDMVEENVRAGGYIFCDNVLFRGMVLREEKPPHKYRTIVVSLRKFLDKINDTEKYQTEVMQKGDGIAIVKVLK